MLALREHAAASVRKHDAGW